MLFTSDLIAQGSGSLNGLTFSHNRYGSYLRNRSTPVNPNTARQQAARNAFAQAAVHWSGTLTEANRVAWNDYAAAVPVLNSIGQTVFLTGFAMFLRSASMAILAGETIVAAGPTVLTLPSVDGTMAATVSEATQLISVAFDNTLDWANEDDATMYVSMMKPVGAGRYYLVGHQRYSAGIDGDSVTPPTSPQTIACPFVCTEAQKVIVSCRIGRADGRLSNPFQDSTDVAA